MKKRIMHIFSRTVWTVVCLYAVIVIAFRVPVVQEKLCEIASKQLSELIKSEVTVGNINPGFLNKLIVDNLVVKDQRGEVMLKSSRVAVSLDIISLINGKVDISSAQLFGLLFNAYKTSEDSPYNFQYALDALASKDTTSASSLDLHIGSLVIRNGQANYDLRYIPRKSTGFDANHVALEAISGHFIIYGINEENVNLTVKHFAFIEKSGFELSDLTLDFEYGNDKLHLTNFNLQLPHSFVNMDDVLVQYPLNVQNLKAKEVKLSGKLSVPAFQVSDLQAFLPFDASAFPVFSAEISVDEEDNDGTVAISLKSINGGFDIETNGKIHSILADNTHPSSPRLSEYLSWKTDRLDVSVRSEFFDILGKSVSLPQQLLALGDISMNGRIEGTRHKVEIQNEIKASKAGELFLEGLYDNNIITAKISSPGFSLTNVLGGSALGNVVFEANGEAKLIDNRLAKASAELNVSQIEYNSYTFSNITAKGIYDGITASANIEIDDPNLALTLEGDVSNVLDQNRHVTGKISIDNIQPSVLNLTDKWGDASFAFNASADVQLSDIDNSTGYLSIDDFVMRGGTFNDENISSDLHIDNIMLRSENSEDEKKISLKSDFADVFIQGHFSISSLVNSFRSVIATQLNTLVGELKNTYNDVSVNATVRSTYPLERLLGLNVSIQRPLTLKGYLTDVSSKTNIFLDAPSIDAFGHHFDNAQVLLWTPENELCTRASLVVNDNPDNPLHINVEAKAADNVIHSRLQWDNENLVDWFAGDVSAYTHLTRTFDGSLAASMNITPSTVHVGDSIWTLRSNGITYENSKLKVDHFFLGNSSQHVSVDGIASALPTDTLHATLKSVNVGYIMNLVNFHSVEFDGFASGRVEASRLFSEPDAHAHLDVEDFRFQYGRMGNLHVNASLNNILDQIDIKAYSDNGDKRYMTINGQVSPQRSDLELNIKAESVPLEFMESFCGSFMQDIDATAHGDICVSGPFSEINLTGKAVVDGAVTISSLNCRYELRGDTVDFVPNDMRLHHQPLYDKYGNVAYITGGLHHRYLSRMTYDFDINADRFLGFDTHEFGNDTFFGTAFLTGQCNITGRSSELTINVRGDVNEGSRIVYNASSPDDITRQEFITWHSQENPYQNTVDIRNDSIDQDDDVRTNMHLNLLLNVSPAASLYLVMDPNTGDYIDLHGSGVLRASYYNKGAFELFGNYLVDHGVYKMTIQNIIHRDFNFLQGGTISFGGDPYNASLNLKASYTLNSVSLSDLNVGRSFSSNNIKVDCLMDITGTPGAPRVSFNLDPQTANTDAKQMIYSLINSEEEMNQQVLYLLAVGRFYAQGNNNASLQENRVNSQTTLAMQSIVSGTISQQMNNILGNVLKSKTWNFGANISPGDEGFTNAEYEGLLNGSLFNNRLLFNGQFGYRDNAATSTQGFIGDFDLRYLIFPNGNLAFRVYNQTNDRYFTRNSLNTQGLGIIIKKDF